ncbi:DUF6795 domain-containing protein [Aliikangiella maris]|uniref:DUF6795 domain-containing protein n=2 Tax=Aliikangiella maris TaxID=3162458 RepID=A0ABV2BWI5_9GAMM
MAFLDGFQFYLFSALKGRVHNNGTPLIGARLTRTALDTYNNKTYTDITQTDEQGLFSFSPVKIWIFRPLLHHESRQTINIEFHGQHKLAWKMTKNCLHHGGEIAYQEDAKMTPIEVDCNWANDEDKEQGIIKKVKISMVLTGIATIINVKNSS